MIIEIEVEIVSIIIIIISIEGMRSWGIVLKWSSS